jgi:hypothetical protein
MQWHFLFFYIEGRELLFYIEEKMGSFLAICKLLIEKRN